MLQECRIFRIIAPKAVFLYSVGQHFVIQTGVSVISTCHGVNGNNFNLLGGRSVDDKHVDPAMARETTV